ncbi:hypothetical protein AB4120_14920 [Cupriavidus sp. 2KB_3]|uniref:hypothetical protein n=1 Tax=Cupriavidus sp. 2KB_3 TaxID=3232980 RepID=UPI003F93DD62
MDISEFQKKYQAYQAQQGSNYGSAIPSGSEPRQPEVIGMVESLSREATEIAAYIDSIEARFGRVLQPTLPVGESCVGNTPYHTSLGGELGDLVERLRTSRRRLESILQRAEI